MRSLWPHSLPLLPNKKQGSRNFSAFLAYAIKSRTEKKTIGQQLPKIQSCRDWTDSLLSLTLHSVWKCPKKLIEYKVFSRYSFQWQICGVFFPEKMRLFLSNIQTEVSNRNSPSFVVLLWGSSELGRRGFNGTKKVKASNSFLKRQHLGQEEGFFSVLRVVRWEETFYMMRRKTSFQWLNPSNGRVCGHFPLL